MPNKEDHLKETTMAVSELLTQEGVGHLLITTINKEVGIKIYDINPLKLGESIAVILTRHPEIFIVMVETLKAISPAMVLEITNQQKGASYVH